MDISAHIDKSRFGGILTVSDIHANLESTIKLIQYADENNLFVVFLGDVVDNGTDPFLVLHLILDECLDKGKGAFVMGNHEKKFYGLAKGTGVKLLPVHIDTIRNYGNPIAFTETMLRLCTHKMSDYVLTYGSWMFIHGAVHGSLWEKDYTSDKKLTSVQRSRALYGEVDGSREKLSIVEKMRNVCRKVKAIATSTEYFPTLGFPIRTYRWVDKVPSRKNVIVGHDRRPLGIPLIGRPLVAYNDTGGKVYFTDTGSSKHPQGGVTGTVLRFVDDDLSFDKFVLFKNAYDEDVPEYVDAIEVES